MMPVNKYLDYIQCSAVCSLFRVINISTPMHTLKLVQLEFGLYWINRPETKSFQSVTYIQGIKSIIWTHFNELLSSCIVHKWQMFLDRYAKPIWYFQRIQQRTKSRFSYYWRTVLIKLHDFKQMVRNVGQDISYCCRQWKLFTEKVSFDQKKSLETTAV